MFFGFGASRDLGILGFSLRACVFKAKAVMVGRPLGPCPGLRITRRNRALGIGPAQTLGRSGPSALGFGPGLKVTHGNVMSARPNELGWVLTKGPGPWALGRL